MDTNGMEAFFDLNCCNSLFPLLKIGSIKLQFDCFFLSYFLGTATQAKATAEMVVAVAVTSDVIVKNVTNVTKWDILHANAKKMLIDATDAMVIY